MINDNKKNTQLIINHIQSLKKQIEQMNQNMKQLNINNLSNQEIKYDDRRYVGQVVNRLK